MNIRHWPLGTSSFVQYVKQSRIKLTTNIILAPRFRMSGARTPLLRVFIVWSLIKHCGTFFSNPIMNYYERYKIRAKWSTSSWGSCLVSQLVLHDESHMGYVISLTSGDQSLWRNSLVQQNFKLTTVTSVAIGPHDRWR
jgi:hypothetical protein